MEIRQEGLQAVEAASVSIMVTYFQHGKKDRMTRCLYVELTWTPSYNVRSRTTRFYTDTERYRTSPTDHDSDLGIL